MTREIDARFLRGGEEEEEEEEEEENERAATTPASYVKFDLQQGYRVLGIRVTFQAGNDVSIC